MAMFRDEVVLVTGACGFLGHHLVKHLLKDKSVLEIHGLDKLPSDATSNFDDECDVDSPRVKMHQKDLIDMESYREIVRKVDVVLHCAALVSYNYPPSKDALRDNNVLATENLLKLCIEEGVSRFVYCSTTEVTLQSFVKGGTFALVLYATETKVSPPATKDRLIFGEYAESKLKAERLVLEANGKTLANGSGVLHTVALRPSLLYGEGDKRFITKFIEMGKKRGNTIPRLAGMGGKQQITYVGNAAWAFICAKNTLRNKPESIAGLPITITDDTPIMDIMRFCQKMTKPSKNCVRPSSWSIPSMISLFIGWILEIVASFNLGFMNKFFVSPRGLIAYMGSLILYDRSRASIHLNYDPYYSADEAIARATSYYCDLVDN